MVRRDQIQDSKSEKMRTLEKYSPENSLKS